MAKIGTAHVEIKPVLNEEALASLIDRIMVDVEQAVAVAITAAIQKGIAGAGRDMNSTATDSISVTFPPSPDNPLA